MPPSPLTEEKETTSDGDLIKCPWCGATHRDLFEYGLEDCESTEVECGECEREFTLSCSIRVTFTATREGKDEHRHMHWCTAGDHEDPEPCFDPGCGVEETDKGVVVGGGRVCSSCAEKRKRRKSQR